MALIQHHACSCSSRQRWPQHPLSARKEQLKSSLHPIPTAASTHPCCWPRCPPSASLPICTSFASKHTGQVDTVIALFHHCPIIIIWWVGNHLRALVLGRGALGLLLDGGREGAAPARGAAGPVPHVGRRAVHAAGLHKGHLRGQGRGVRARCGQGRAVLAAVGRGEGAGCHKRHLHGAA